MVAPTSSRWVLAFNRDCWKCARLAARVEQLADRRLQCEPLDAPEIVAARRQAFGDDPPWTPTLLSLHHREVRAWTGLGLALRLMRLLGPLRAWRVLGEVRALADRPPTPRPPETDA